jgi:hypothetical protein
MRIAARHSSPQRGDRRGDGGTGSKTAVGSPDDRPPTGIRPMWSGVRHRSRERATAEAKAAPGSKWLPTDRPTIGTPIGTTADMDPGTPRSPMVLRAADGSATDLRSPISIRPMRTAPSPPTIGARNGQTAKAMAGSRAGDGSADDRCADRNHGQYGAGHAPEGGSGDRYGAAPRRDRRPVAGNGAAAIGAVPISSERPTDGPGHTGAGKRGDRRDHGRIGSRAADGSVADRCCDRDPRATADADRNTAPQPGNEATAIGTAPAAHGQHGLLRPGPRRCGAGHPTGVVMPASSLSSQKWNERSPFRSYQALGFGIFSGDHFTPPTARRLPPPLGLCRAPQASGAERSNEDPTATARRPE